jgi:hypothetical protein
MWLQKRHRSYTHRLFATIVNNLHPVRVIGPRNLLHRYTEVGLGRAGSPVILHGLFVFARHAEIEERLLSL